MTSVFDVAAYILEKQGAMTAMKLQKLCYYSHAWHLVWEERPLFGNRIEAWANGPVVRDLYRAHRGDFQISVLPEWCDADPGRIDVSERESIDAVLNFYAKMSAHELSQLTHAESPWADARLGVPDGVRSDRQIGDADMFAFYDGLTSR